MNRGRAWKWYHGIPVSKGGPGSGHHGHAGRPGQRGGSAASGGAGVVSPMQAPEYEGSESWSDRMYAHLSSRLPVPEDFDEEEVQEMSWDDAEIEVCAEVKREIVEQLSEMTGISESDVNTFVHQWAETSNDRDMRSLAIQRDAAEEFNVPLSEWQQGLLREVKGESLLSEIQQRKLLRAMHENTQKQLSEAGFKPNETVRLYRGFKTDDLNWKNGDVLPYKGNSIESWSVSPDLAREFGYVFVADIPIKSILSTARSGFGCLNEGEMVVFGSVSGSKVLAWVEASYEELMGW